MKMRIIGVPSAWGTMELGARRTPRLLREAGLGAWLAAAGHDVEDGGDVPVPPQGEHDAWSATAQARATAPLHVQQVAEMARAVRTAVGTSLRDGRLPIIVGGECCLAIGAIAALSKHGGAATVAWLDAHGDINTVDTSASGLVTGMPLAAALGHGHAALTAVGKDAERPHAGATFLLGGRDLDAGEVDNIAAFGVRHVDTESIRAAGPEEVAMAILGVPEVIVMPPEARAQLAATDAEATAAIAAAPRANAYLHFDVDVLDPQYAPGVHYRVDDGFDPAEVGTLAGYLCASGCVGAITVASANLDHDVDNLTVESIRTVLTSIADALATVDSHP